jgi:ABC-2 type transport system ATP-binding protein
MIQVKSLTKKYPGVTALDNVSLEVRRGEFFGLLGPNGAGKSTLMSLLVGYRDADGGEVIINGTKVRQSDAASRVNVGFVPQSIALYDDVSAEANLEIFGSLYGLKGSTLRERVKERLDAVQLYERRRDKVATFSGGMKRRLNLAAGLLHDPAILLCDEPTVGVDPQSRNAIFDYLLQLNAQGKTIVYTTHYMEEVERLCDRIAIIDFGKVIADGTLEEVLRLLPFEESVFVAKTPATQNAAQLFQRFGSVINEGEAWELKLNGGRKLSEFFSTLEDNGISASSVELRKPTLEAVFLHLTGRRLRD